VIFFPKNNQRGMAGNFRAVSSRTPPQRQVGVGQMLGYARLIELRPGMCEGVQVVFIAGLLVPGLRKCRSRQTAGSGY